VKHACSPGAHLQALESVEIQSPKKKAGDTVDGHVGAQRQTGSWKLEAGIRARQDVPIHSVGSKQQLLVLEDGLATSQSVERAVKALVPRERRDGLDSFKFIAANPTHLSCGMNECANDHRTSALLGA
jgi:hypothetical protein